MTNPDAVKWHYGRLAGTLLVRMGIGAVLAVAIKTAVVYIVDSARPASHWTVYESVQPTQYRWPLGSKPTFRTKSIRFHDITMSWNDLMYCRPTSGPLKGKLMHVGSARGRYFFDIEGDENAGARIPVDETPMGSVGAGAQYHVTAAYIGFDEPGIGDNLEYKILEGYWTWEKPLPTEPSVCYVVPQPFVHPSPGVTKQVPVDETRSFEFYDPAQEGKQ